MSKYQKALENIGMTVIDSLSNGYDSPKYVKDFCYGDYNILQELVDKATPKKPLKHPSYKFSFIDNILKQQKLYICPTCRNACLVRIAPNERNENRYCYDCGQALDWSDE